MSAGVPGVPGVPKAPMVNELADLAELVATRRVLVTCGAGGVGKTTTAAALGIAAAMSGRRVCVVTIDPAKRLADALGLKALGNRPQRVDLTSLTGTPGTGGANRESWWAPIGGTKAKPGELWALMLDASATFDDLIRMHAPTPEQAERILANTLYRNISGALSGTQEYMAVEKLHELVNGPRTEDGTVLDGFDCVIVDTPPTRNALDFLAAPERLTRFLDNRVFRTMMAPARSGLRVVGVAAQAALAGLGKVVGTEVIGDAVAFFRAFDGMEDGFRARAQSSLALLRNESTAWILVTTPRVEPVDEALFFTAELQRLGLKVSALVANRVQLPIDPLPAIPASSGPLRTAVMRAHEIHARADAHRSVLAPLRQAIGPTSAFAAVPLSADDIHDLRALSTVASDLVRPSSPVSSAKN
jgi:anion-transporting  ArsA/GET3 family ATPase